MGAAVNALFQNGDSNFVGRLLLEKLNGSGGHHMQKNSYYWPPFSARNPWITAATTGHGPADLQREVHPPESEADVRILPDQVAPPEAARRCQKVPEGLRHGPPGAVVHAVQVEEGLHQIRGGQLKLLLRLFEPTTDIYEP